MSTGLLPVKFSLTEPDTGYTCSNYDLGYDKSKLQVKWQTIKTNGRRATVATNNSTVASFTVVSTTPVVYSIVSAPITKGAFAGSQITFTTVLDVPYQTLIDQCNGAGIAGFDFGHVDPSSISVP